MNLGSEFRLFCLALRRPQSPDNLVEMRGLAAGIADWEVIVHGARRHGVAPFVLAGLEACGSKLPAEVVAGLRRLNVAGARRSLTQVMEIGRLGRLFAGAGIRLLVLKGVVLSAQLYGVPGLRAPRDIDLLVDPDDFKRAQRILLEAGYQQTLNLHSPGQHVAFLQWVKEIEYSHPQTGSVVELHHRITDNPNLLAIDFATLWNEREEIGLGDFAVATLPRHSLPLYLCVHGAVHGWTRLDWLMDFAAALRQAESIDAVAAAADACGVTWAFRHALMLTHDWLGAPIDRDAVEPYRDRAPIKRRDWLLAHLYNATDWHTAAAFGSWKRFQRLSVWSRLYRLSIKSDWRYRVSEAKRELFSSADWDIVALPQALSWLYLFVRPWGWLVRRLGLSGRPAQARK